MRTPLILLALAMVGCQAPNLSGTTTGPEIVAKNTITNQADMRAEGDWLLNFAGELYASVVDETGSEIAATSPVGQGVIANGRFVLTDTRDISIARIEVEWGDPVEDAEGAFYTPAKKLIVEGFDGKASDVLARLTERHAIHVAAIQGMTREAALAYIEQLKASVDIIDRLSGALLEAALKFAAPVP